METQHKKHDHVHKGYEHSHNKHHHNHTHTNEQKTKWVVILTAITMVVEISFGYWTNSMALLADGWHMASHVFALGLSWVAYYIARKYSQTDKYSFNKEKLLALAGFTSAVALLIVALLMAIESVQRLMNPMEIFFKEAILVAIVGLVVNIVSALFLHHDHEHRDHNIHSAYLHVLADGLTSMAAIVALTAGMVWNIYWLDCISGIISSIVITKWAVDLMNGSGKDLIDFRKNRTVER